MLCRVNLVGERDSRFNYSFFYTLVGGLVAFVRSVGVDRLICG